MPLFLQPSQIHCHLVLTKSYRGPGRGLVSSRLAVGNTLVGWVLSSWREFASEHLSQHPTSLFAPRLRLSIPTPVLPEN